MLDVRLPAATLIGGAFLASFIVLPLPDPITLPKLALAEIVLASLLVMLAAAWWRRGTPIRSTAADRPLLVFAAGAIASTALGIAPLLSLFGAPARQDGLLSLLLYVALAWVVAQVVTTPAQALRVRLAIVAGAYVASILALLDVARLAGPDVGTAETAFTFAGLARAAGPLGNPNVLGALLAMGIPLAVGAFAASPHCAARIALANVVAVLVLALTLTFSRSAWIAALAGLVLVTAPRWGRVSRRTLAVAGAALVGVVGVIGIAAMRDVPVAAAIVSRAAALADPGGSLGTRAHLWSESLAIVRDHALLGVGPGAFGLAYPGVQTGDWTGGALVDKAHAEPLDVAATLGVLGLGASAWILAMVLRAASAQRPSSGGAFGATVGYLVALSVNFTALPAAIPFWILAGSILGPLSRPLSRAARRPAVALAVVLAIALAANAGRSVAAEAAFGDVASGADAVERALALAPERTDYAELAGDLAHERGDLAAAADRYEHAARVGVADPALHWKLAFTYDELGLHAQAASAAATAVRLHPFDPRNDALLCQLDLGCK